MKYGIYLPPFADCGDAQTLADLALEAENAGWDGFFLWDHIAGWDLDMVDPWIALAAIAMNTTTIRLGTTVTPLPRRRPWKLAREAASLDRLSNGRLILGVGSGGGKAEFDHFAEERDPHARGEMLDEALEIITGLWTGEPFSYAGKHYTVEETRFSPIPLQQPRIPIWVGGNWPNKPPFRRAARWDGVFALYQTYDDLSKELALMREMLDFVNRHRGVERLGDVGRLTETGANRTSEAPFDIISMGITPLGDPKEAGALVARFIENGATWWLELVAPYAFGQDLDEGPWPMEGMRQRILEGPPQP